jgi:hypothetical protein
MVRTLNIRHLGALVGRFAFLLHKAGEINHEGHEGHEEFALTKSLREAG